MYCQQKEGKKKKKKWDRENKKEFDKAAVFISLLLWLFKMFFDQLN